jgi:hypothetical protein
MIARTPILVTGAAGQVGLGALAVLRGVANAAQALRVRETAQWFLPASVFAVILGLVALAAPASVGAALVRGLGAAQATGPRDRRGQGEAAKSGKQDEDAASYPATDHFVVGNAHRDSLYGM